MVSRLGLGRFSALATLLAIWLKVSTALSEIVVGTVAQLVIGAFLGRSLGGSSEWVTFLAGISALFGLNHGVISQAQYSYLVAAVIGSAVIPALITNAFFVPSHLLADSAPLAEVTEAIGEVSG